ncbi:hypothetical protein [Nitrospira sp. Kam-Ns4a]
MRTWRLALRCWGVGLGLLLQGCIGMWPPDMIARDDHVGLAKYYEYEAKALREKARVWEAWAESYERHRPPHGTLEVEQHAAHCRAIAQSYAKAADEAEALARDHRAMRPHGVVN